MSAVLRTSGFVANKEYVWCIPRGYAGMFEINIETGEAFLIYALPEEKIISNFISAIDFGDEAYFVCLGTGTIIKLRKADGKCWNYISDKAEGIYASAVLYGDKIYLVPKNAENNLLAFDIKLQTFEIEKSWADQTAKYNAKGIIYNVCVDEKGNIVCTVNEKQSFCIYNILTKKIYKMNIRYDDEFKCVLPIGEEFYFLPWKRHEIVVWDFNSGQFRIISNSVEAKESYVREIRVGDKIFFQTDHTLEVYDYVAGEFLFNDSVPKEIDNMSKGSTLFFQGIKREDNYYLFPYGTSKMIKMDFEGNFKATEIAINEKDIYHLKTLQNSEIIEGDISLEGFIQFLNMKISC